MRYATLHSRKHDRLENESPVAKRFVSCGTCGRIRCLGRRRQSRQPGIVQEAWLGEREVTAPVRVWGLPERCPLRAAIVALSLSSRTPPAPGFRDSAPSALDAPGVHVDHDPLRPDPESSRALPNGPRDGQAFKQCRVASVPVDQPKRRRVRSDRPDQRLLVTGRAEILQTVADVGEHHRTIPNRPAGVMTFTPLAHHRQPSRPTLR